MKPGDHLIDNEHGETPYRIEELIAAGDRYQIAGAHDDAEDRPVVVRAILYGDEAMKGYVTGRRADLKNLWHFLESAAGSAVAPEPVEWLEIRESPVGKPPEPVIVCERIDGPNVFEWVTEEHPSGIEPAKALAIADELAGFLGVIHKAQWLWRDFDPRRFVISESGSIRGVSISRVVKRGVALDEEQLKVNPAYVAPEIRDEMTGKMQRPAADLYGLGALLSFLLTGEEPRHRVESPLAYTAYERLQELEMPGLELLIARLLQPLAKNRISRAEKLRPFCSVEGLPKRQMKGFEMSMLPAPWLGLEMESPEKNRGLRSKLSAGPLVSMGRDQAVSELNEKPETETEDGQMVPNWPLIIGAIFVLAVIVVFVIVSGDTPG